MNIKISGRIRELHRELKARWFISAMKEHYVLGGCKGQKGIE